MTGKVHKLYIGTMVAIGFTTLVILAYWGFSYYQTDITERPFHDDHNLMKPSGPIGHGLGILGTLMILVGVFSYIGRKKKKFLPRVGALKHWLEFHIFLCSVGPILILFHTAFKFGGIVSISFWSMVAVVLSGIIGRFIYIQIPRTIQGRELSLVEIKSMKDELSEKLKAAYGIEEAVYAQLRGATAIQLPERELGLWERIGEQRRESAQARQRVKEIMKTANLTNADKRGIMKLVNHEMRITGRINRLQTMQQLFKYWHVAHLPFALVMLVIMVIHVAITLAFGYKWIF
jgi:hypothetical protein